MFERGRARPNPGGAGAVQRHRQHRQPEGRRDQVGDRLAVQGEPSLQVLEDEPRDGGRETGAQRNPPRDRRLPCEQRDDEGEQVVHEVPGIQPRTQQHQKCQQQQRVLAREAAVRGEPRQRQAEPDDHEVHASAQPRRGDAELVWVGAHGRGHRTEMGAEEPERLPRMEDVAGAGDDQPARAFLDAR